MNSKRSVVLKPGVAIEPRVNGWYAWPLLVYPATLGLISRNGHLKMLESFARAPQVHLSALRNPALRGGPFVNYTGPRERVQALIDATRQALAEELSLAAAWSDTSARLQQADGGSLEPWYAELPAPLRGVSELRYDAAGRASLRLIEPLVYRRFGAGAHQALRLVDHPVDERPFALSTPVFEGDPGLMLHTAFSGDTVEFLAQCRQRGQPLGALRERLRALCGGHLDDAALETRIATLVQDAPDAAAPVAAPFAGPGLRVRYFGHASVLVEAAGLAVMIDPGVALPSPGGTPRYTADDLPAHIDFVLLTHNHQDHVLLETLLPLRRRIGTVVVPRTCGNGCADASLKHILAACGFRHVAELGEMDSLPVRGGRITGLPFLGEHGDLDVLGKLAYAVQCDGASAVFLADSNNLDPTLYDAVAQELGPVDALFIGMECAGAPMSWLYGPLLARPLSHSQDQSRRLNGSDADKALAIARAFRPAAAFVYAMGAEPWLRFLSSIAYGPQDPAIVQSQRFVQDMQAQGVVAERLYGRREMHLPGGRQVRLVGAPVAEPF